MSLLSIGNGNIRTALLGGLAVVIIVENHDTRNRQAKRLFIPSHR